MQIVISGALVASAVIVFLAVTVRAEAKAHLILAQARKDLFEDTTRWRGHPMKAAPRMRKWAHHPNYAQFMRIYQREQRNVLRQIGWGAMASAVLILISRL